MANEEQLEVLKQGAKVWNEWRSKHSNDSIVLDGAKLRGYDLWKADLSEANLIGADLKGANLGRAIIRDSHLLSTNFEEANLGSADLRRAALFDANLSKADLIEADLSGAHLDRVKFSGARIGNTVFSFTILSSAIGLATVQHVFPSSLGVETIQQSNGQIPEIFLRGCGLSDLDIEHAKLAAPGLDAEQVTNITYKMHQLYVKSGIEYYSCFISYNSKDEEFAKQLHDDLQNNGVRCWFDREDLKIGDAIRPTIDRQIRLRDKLLVILSENSIKSEWVGDEVEGALEEEQKGNRSVLFPIRLDDTALNTRDDWAAKIKRRRHIGDFSNWKDKASYQKAFERLLRDLKAAG